MHRLPPQHASAETTHTKRHEHVRQSRARQEPPGIAGETVDGGGAAGANAEHPEGDVKRLGPGVGAVASKKQAATHHKECRSELLMFGLNGGKEVSWI
jgi:hypothetical protein